MYAIQSEETTLNIQLLTDSIETKFHFQTILRTNLKYDRYAIMSCHSSERKLPYLTLYDINLFYSGPSDSDTEVYMSDTCSEISNFSFSSRISNMSTGSKASTRSKRERKRNGSSSKRKPLVSIKEADVTNYGVF